MLASSDRLLSRSQVELSGSFPACRPLAGCPRGRRPSRPVGPWVFVFLQIWGLEAVWSSWVFLPGAVRRDWSSSAPAGPGRALYPLRRHPEVFRHRRGAGAPSPAAPHPHAALSSPQALSSGTEGPPAISAAPPSLTPRLFSASGWQPSSSRSPPCLSPLLGRRWESLMRRNLNNKKLYPWYTLSKMWKNAEKSREDKHTNLVRGPCYCPGAALAPGRIQVWAGLLPAVASLPQLLVVLASGGSLASSCTPHLRLHPHLLPLPLPASQSDSFPLFVRTQSHQMRGPP